jgi:galactokinase
MTSVFVTPTFVTFVMSCIRPVHSNCRQDAGLSSSSTIDASNETLVQACNVAVEAHQSHHNFHHCSEDNGCARHFASVPETKHAIRDVQLARCCESKLFKFSGDLVDIVAYQRLERKTTSSSSISNSRLTFLLR